MKRDQTLIVIFLYLVLFRPKDMKIKIKFLSQLIQNIYSFDSRYLYLNLLKLQL